MASLVLLRRQQHLLVFLVLFVGILHTGIGFCILGCECRNENEHLYADCSGRNFSEFPDIPEELIGKLVSLDLTDNRISSLSESMPRLPSLRTLSLSRNAIHQLPRRWLLRIPELRHLDLSGNLGLALHALGDDAFIYARFLQELNLSRADVRDNLELATRALHSHSLEVLDLSKRKLPEIRVPLLAGLPNLHILDLSENPLRLEMGLASPVLEELRLARTALDSISPSTLRDLPRLRALDVSGNRDFAFPEIRGVLSETLTDLRARHCDVRLHSLKAFPNLKYVNLQLNGIQTVWDASFDNAVLAELDLSSNNIHRIHQNAFQRLPQLERLNLANNKIVSLHPDVFATNENLVMVNLSRNLLPKMEELRVDKLATLDISQCEVAKLTPHNFLKMPALRTLNLSSNRLEAVPDCLTSSSLRMLDLSYCRLTSVNNNSFRLLSALQELSLAGNRFTSPPNASAFANNLKLRSVRLRDNPWRCDCSSEEFHSLMHYLLVRDKDEVTNHARCSSPPHVDGSTWLQACFDELFPSVDEQTTRRSFALILVAAVVGVGGSFILVSAVRKKIRRRRNKRERRREESLERRIQERERELRRQLRPGLDDDFDLEYAVLRSHAQPRRTASTITQPPTYEEALLLSRSQQDLLNETSRGASAGILGTDGATAAAAPSVASLASLPDVTPASATCARHTAYEVQVQVEPKPKPPKPPRKTGRNGDRLSTALIHTNENSSEDVLANVQMETVPYVSVVNGEILTAAISNSNVANGSDHVSSVHEGNMITGIADMTAAHPHFEIATSLSPSPHHADGKTGDSEASSSTLSTPAVQRQRPLSAYSSDASGEDSDEPRTQR